jgi:hypothetical protein
MEKAEIVFKFKFRKNVPHDIMSVFKLFCKAYKICALEVSFLWTDDQYFIPTSGDYNILGVSLEIKQYIWLELLEIIYDNEVSLYFNEYPNFKEDILCMSSYPSEIKYFSRINYPSTITHLEKLRLVKTKPSISFLSTDGRSFCICEKDKNNDWYEVDILGTPYGKDIADVVYQLYQGSI